MSSKLGRRTLPHGEIITPPLPPLHRTSLPLLVLVLGHQLRVFAVGDLSVSRPHTQPWWKDKTKLRLHQVDRG